MHGCKMKSKIKSDEELKLFFQCINIFSCIQEKDPFALYILRKATHNFSCFDVKKLCLTHSAQKAAGTYLAPGIVKWKDQVIH